MIDNHIKAVLAANCEVLKNMGVTALFVFGSRNRGQHTADSDLDLFIDYASGHAPSFLKLMTLEMNLQEELGFPVHITTRQALRPEVRKAAEAEASKIF
ncbi:MAG: nucleotidyltransferase domain-containing protein [Alphaproteobacteria bacterium]|nr:nucleotidyltransferase domain-containing protein [Alphaproteobacteria bacterium]